MYTYAMRCFCLLCVRAELVQTHVCQCGIGQALASDEGKDVLGINLFQQAVETEELHSHSGVVFRFTPSTDAPRRLDPQLEDVYSNVSICSADGVNVCFHAYGRKKNLGRTPKIGCSGIAA